MVRLKPKQQAHKKECGYEERWDGGWSGRGEGSAELGRCGISSFSMDPKEGKDFSATP